MKVVVFGGSGFLGSHISDELSKIGHDVTVFDLYSSKWIRSDQKMVIGDIQDLELLIDVIKGAEVVYNFAALADLNKAKTDPIATVKTNILGNLNILEASRICNVKRFILASSLYVYSQEGSFYRCSKQAAEDYVKEYQEEFGLNFTILRYGSLYGPRADNTNGLLRIIRTGLKDGYFSYEGNIESSREYIHVLDAANASIIALDEVHKNESLTLSGVHSIKVIDLLKMLSEIMGYSDKTISFKDGDYIGHYVRTPYSYRSNYGKKLNLSSYRELGQGLLEVISDEGSLKKNDS